MSGHSTRPNVQVGDGEAAASLNKHGDRNALEVDSGALLQAINEQTELLREIRDLIASQL